jgi:hypothetical protein
MSGYGKKRWFQRVALLFATQILSTNDGYTRMLVRLVTRRQNNKKINPSARPTPRHISFSFSGIQRMTALWYQKLYTNIQTYSVGNHVLHVIQMV